MHDEYLMALNSRYVDVWDLTSGSLCQQFSVTGGRILDSYGTFIYGEETKIKAAILTRDDQSN